MQKFVNMEYFLRYQNAETRNSETDKITKIVNFECFHILSYQIPKLHAKLALCGKKMTLPEKCLFNVFKLVTQ